MFMTNLDRALASENLARVLNNLSNVLETLLRIFNIETILTSLKRALAVHSSDVIVGS